MGEQEVSGKIRPNRGGPLAAIRPAGEWLDGDQAGRQVEAIKGNQAGRQVGS